MSPHETSPTGRERGSAVTPGLPDPPLPFTAGRFPADEAEHAAAERRVVRLFIVAPLVSLGILLTGFYVGLGRVTALGAIGLGLTATTIGALAIAERRLVFIRGGALTPRPYRYFIYEGFAAIPYGLAFLVAGSVLGIAGAMHIAGRDLESMRAAVLARPHLVLLPVGAYLLFHGLGFVIGFRRAAASWSERLSTALAHLPAQLGGLILMALAVGSLALGLTEWLRPDVFRQEFQSFFGNPWPFDPATNDTG